MKPTTYITLRNKKVTTRPYRLIPTDERRQILIEAIADPKAARVKHNISSATLHHLRWHCYKLLEGQKTVIDTIHELREAGLNSARVSERLGIPLERVNKLWVETPGNAPNQVTHEKTNFLSI